MKTTDTWQTDLPQQHPGFNAIREQLAVFDDYPNFPNIDQYNQYSKKIINANNQLIQFYQQDEICNEHYEQKVYEAGLVNTRENNWHDFFNYIVWQKFPKTKATINQLQYQDFQTQQFAKKRTPRQNFLTQFDESGVIILSDNDELISLLRHHQWRELFWDKRELLQEQMQFIVFGHAIYEKLLSPYIGLTAKGIILDSKQPIDDALAEYLQSLKNSRAKDLQPVPLLGIPGWHEDTNNSDFYNNTNYFRPS